MFSGYLKKERTEDRDVSFLPEPPKCGMKIAPPKRFNYLSCSEMLREKAREREIEWRLKREEEERKRVKSRLAEISLLRASSCLSRQQLTKHIKFCAEKREWGLVEHLLTTFPVPNRGGYEYVNILHEAITSESPKVVSMLLKYPLFSPNPLYNSAGPLGACVRYGRLEAAKIIISHPLFEARIYKEGMISDVEKAVHKNHVDVVKLVLEENLLSEKQLSTILYTGSKFPQNETLKLLFNSWISTLSTPLSSFKVSQLFRIIANICICTDTKIEFIQEIVETILTFYDLDLVSLKNLFLSNDCLVGYEYMELYHLEKCDRIKDFYISVDHSSKKCINHFLTHTSFDSRFLFKALMRAVRGGIVRRVEILLSYQRVNPGKRKSRALRVAAQLGYKGIVCLLLKDPRVDPTRKNNEAFRVAKEKKYNHIVKVLWADKRVRESLLSG